MYIIKVIAPGLYCSYPILNSCPLAFKHIQLFQEMLSEKVHATFLKGIVGGFECTVLQRHLKEWHLRPQTHFFECSRKATKVGSTATVVRNSVLIISHIAFYDCPMHIFSDTLS